jgi:filamentous hemagglutinin family protein
LLAFVIGIGAIEYAHSATSITPTSGAGQLGTTVTQNGNVYGITGGKQVGNNLYHSFGQFSVGTGAVAQYQTTNLVPNASMQNILSRVTGGSPSSIFGAIDSATYYPNANFFFMNPAGILFGPSATINVGGMVAFSTADYLRLTDNARFNAVGGPADLLLTAAPVAAFGFLGNNPAAIAIQGSTLQVADGKALSFVGGNQGFTATDPDTGNPVPVQGGVTMTGGKLSAPGGQINIASVAGPGEISAVDFVPTQGMAMGNISLSQGAILDVSADAAGTVRIRGGQLVMAEATISADTVNSNGTPTAVDIQLSGDMSISNDLNPAITARTTGSGDAGRVSILSANLNASSNTTDLLTLIDTHTEGTGKGGDVNITTGNLVMTGSMQGFSTFINSGTQGAGNGGNVTINAQNIEIDISLISTGTFWANNFGIDATGSAGNVTISTGSLNMAFSQIVTDAFSVEHLTGKSGNISITAHDINLDTTPLSAQGIQQGGAITITTDHLSATNSPIILQTALLNGGPLNITGRSIDLSGNSNVLSSTGGDGNAGSITITATDHLGLLGNISDASGIFSNSRGTFGTQGNAGNVVITTPRLDMTGGSRINTVTATSGHGGNVTINTTGPIAMSGETTSPPPEPMFSLGDIQSSGIFTRTIGGNCSGPCGNAGNISINTRSLTMGTGSQINSGTTSSGQGGNIAITAGDTVTMSGTLTTGQPGGIQSRSTGADPDAGAGGNISLTAGQSVTIADGASVSASTTGPGNAGNILVKSNDIAVSGGGTITAASTGLGHAGTVTIQGLNNPANSLLIDGAGSGVFTTTSGSGPGGNITVDTNAVNLTNGASITASSTGPGNTGNINISAGNQFAMTNSTVTTEASQSGGGAIKITTNPNGTVQLTNSTISASVLDGNGGGGSVNIDPQSVVLINSQILANAVFGPGGNIFISTNLLLPDTASVISASSQFGQQGTITVQSPISPASGKIIPLSQKPLVATTLLSRRCAALAGGDISSFTVAGRDSLPAEPGAWLSTPLALSAPESGHSAVAEASSHTSVSETSDDRPLLSLRKITPPGFLTQSFAVDGLAGCAS